MASILIVDDELEVREAIRRVLERAGFEVAEANSAAGGLELVEDDPPDIVVTDIIMPRVHGVDFIKALHERHSRVQVIAISGGGSFGLLAYEPDAISTHAYLAAARAAGAREVLTKPFDMADLLDAVRKLLPN